MNLVFIGKQGSGKGTQAKLIAKKLNICHISTGDLLRHAKGGLKEKIDSSINSGKLVSDELIFELLKERVGKTDSRAGFILDGYPRNLVQAKKLKENFEIDKVFEIFISDEQVLERLINRMNCKNCGAIFNRVTNPPRVEGICDKCGEKLFVREDDNESAIKKRLEIYKKDTKPVLEFFKDKMLKVDGSKNIKEVDKEIKEELGI